MKIITHLENNALRVGIEIPNLPKYDCGCSNSDYVVPIAIVGDSAQSIPWRMLKMMVSQYHLETRPFILDLLLINGTPNRYFEVDLDPNGGFNLKAVAFNGGKVSDVIHRRSTTLQYKFSKNLGSNVLTPAEVFALTNNVELAQKVIDE